MPGRLNSRAARATNPSSALLITDRCRMDRGGGSEQKEILMKNGLKILACMAACLSTLPLARSALADNRAYIGCSAVFDQASSASCFAHAPGDWSLKNSCSSRQSVFLPTSVDAAR